MEKEADILGKIMRVSRNEWPRVFFGFTLKLFNKAGLMVAWTIFLTLFISKYEISSLPFLIFSLSVVTVLGMLLFSTLASHFKAKYLIIVNAFIAAVLMFVAITFFSDSMLFFALGVLAIGLFGYQITILLSNFLEDIFTPLEAERLLPVVESSEIVGTLVGGLLLTILSQGFPIQKLMLIWVVLLVILAAIVYFFEPRTGLVYHTVRRGKDYLQQFQHHLHGMKKSPFLMGLLLIFLLQAVVGSLLEFHYTQAIEHRVPHGDLSNYQLGLLNGFTHFQMFFATLALILQLFFANRILATFGTIGGFLIHGFLTFFSSIFMCFGAVDFSSILAKNNFELSNIVNKGAYESSYYAFRTGTQRVIREVLEAFILPVGNILGSVLIFLLYKFSAQFMTPFIIGSFALVCITITWKLQDHFTLLARENLWTAKTNVERIHAVETLVQKGHRKAVQYLLEYLATKKPEKSVSIKIFKSLALVHDATILPVLFDNLKNDDHEIVLEVLKTLGKYFDKNKAIVQQPFSYYRFTEDLKYLFETTKDETIRIEVILCLSYLKDNNIATFLLEKMRSSSPKVLAACIKACGFFDDMNAIYFLEPFLSSGNIVVKTSAMASLWRFDSYRPKISVILKDLLKRGGKKNMLALFVAFHDIDLLSHQKEINVQLKHVDATVRFYAAIALLRLGKTKALSTITNLLFDENKVLLTDIQQLGSIQLEKKVRRKIHHMLTAQVFQDRDLKSLGEHIDYEKLDKYRKIFEIFGLEQEFFTMELLLQPIDAE